jgi:hypothetical protein
VFSIELPGWATSALAIGFVLLSVYPSWKLFVSPASTGAK